jgi:hypothetical protein
MRTTHRLPQRNKLTTLSVHAYLHALTVSVFAAVRAYAHSVFIITLLFSFFFFRRVALGRCAD